MYFPKLAPAIFRNCCWNYRSWNNRSSSWHSRCVRSRDFAKFFAEAMRQRRKALKLTQED